MKFLSHKPASFNVFLSRFYEPPLKVKIDTVVYFGVTGIEMKNLVETFIM